MKINNNITSIVGIMLFSLGLLKIATVYILQSSIAMIAKFLTDLHFGSFSSTGYMIDIKFPVALSAIVMILGVFLVIKNNKA